MAGTCVHLAVATELNRKLSGDRCRWLGNMGGRFVPELFFAGNICPDGIMARQNYQREMKLHTHLRDGIPDGSFQDPGNLSLFRKRLYDFFVDNVYEKKRNFSLYLGYLTHLLTDEKFILEIHSQVLQSLEKAGYSRQNPKTFALFGQDVDQIDFRLVAEYPGMQDAYRALNKVSPYEITDLITEQELTESREWILSYFFREKHSWETPLFLSYEKMYHFIPEAVREILDRLPEYLR